MKSNYELVVVFEPEIKAEEKEKLLTGLKKTITEKGKILKEEDWGKKELAYPIKKQRSGLFCWFSFEAESDLPQTLEKKTKLEEKIIRFLLTKE